jgi:hypothetical protein
LLHCSKESGKLILVNALLGRFLPKLRPPSGGFFLAVPWVWLYAVGQYEFKHNRMADKRFSGISLLGECPLELVMLAHEDI